ncbi:cation diffusion facilitator family transporter [Parvularcula sp. LCG005]|uniref:cation diffusion facilitator family transporter n=1 Tax=Parvularcula sp. LCG005 TaxID=3078805 RepID=UPI002942919A|nr:cation diffusion facilitator family transporter [Parvularcula sp. LCG005]WOI54379.1 cation diffusion facilitator family transporter [Parvularcula sp. LCG005]
MVTNHNHDAHDGHDHGPGHHHDHSGISDNRRLFIALLVISVFCVVEIIGGILSGSLALLADAGHMVTDAAAIALALWARWLAAKPSSAAYTYGKKRAQVLAAFVNGLALFVLIGFLLYESFERMASPHPIEAKTMLLVATLGLFANFLAFYVLHRGATHDVNMRGALLHVIGDMLGSVAAIISAGVIAAFGWLIIDPIVTIAVSLLIARSAWSLTRETARILMEGAPPSMAPDAVRSALKSAVPEVRDIHDLRIWMLTPDVPQMTMHVQVAHASEAPKVLRDIKAVLNERFGITHSTIQVEPVPTSSEERKLSADPMHCPDRPVHRHADNVVSLTPGLHHG